MSVKESTHLKLSKGAETFYFCSQHCLKKFAAQNLIPIQDLDTCCMHERSSWMMNKIVILSAILVLACLLSYVFPILDPFRESLISYFKKIWWAILLGLVIGGAIDYYIPREYISHILSQKKKRTIVHAVGLGFLMSVCSHGILAIAIQLYKKGASTAAVVAFLLASPWTTLPLALILIGFFGVIKTLFLMGSAIAVAITTGLIYQILEKNEWVETNFNTTQLEMDFSIAKDIRHRWHQYHFSLVQLQNDVKGVWNGGLSLANMVLWWILLGTALASLAGAYIPQHIFHQYMGPTMMGMLVTLGVATIIEVCSEGTTPLAFEIYNQTGAVGNSLVFLMAGVATDYTEIGLIWQNIGRKAALWLPVITVPQILLLGWIANQIFR